MAITATKIKNAAWPAKAREPFSAAYLFKASIISFFPAGIDFNGP